MSHEIIPEDFSASFSLCEFSPPHLRIIDALLRASPDIIMVTSREGKFLYIGVTAARLIGCSPEEILGLTARELGYPPMLPPRLDENRQKVLETNQPLTELITLLTGTGRRTVEFTFSPVSDGDGETCAVLTVGRDVTERHEAQRERQALAAIIDSSEDAILSKDLNGIVLSWNRAAERIFGYTAEEIIGKPKLILFPVDRVQEEVDILARLGAGKRIETFETVRVRKDRTPIMVSVSISPIYDNDGKIIGASTIIHDITERKRAENERRVLEYRLKAILDKSPAFITIRDLDGRYVYANPQFEAIFHRPVEEALGKTNAELFASDIAELSDERDRVVLETRTAQTDDVTLSLPDGEVLLVSLRFPLFDRSGNIDAICTISTDVTNQRQLEAQFLQAQKMEGIGRLAGGIAHDFNNLLTAIIGYSELAEMEAEPESKIHNYLSTVQQAAMRAAALTQQLLAFARKQVIDPKIFNLNDLILETDKLLRRVIGEDIELVTLAYPDLGFVRADPNQITQVLVNLAVNARDAMPDGGKLTIETDNIYLDETYTRGHAEVLPGAYILLALSDTGTGMTDEVKAQIFEPFFTTKEQGKGTGLGLATCYGIVRQNGGHIWVYSEVGQGTIFKVYLPRVDSSVETPPVAETLMEIPEGTETILVVEDEPLLRILAVELLRAHGYTVLEATNGSDGERVAREFAGEIHLVLTDIVMPHMGGRELVQRLREVRPEIKVLYISGYTENSIVQHGILDAGIAFLQKPYTPAVLARKVREVLTMQTA